MPRGYDESLALAELEKLTGPAVADQETEAPQHQEEATVQEQAGTEEAQAGQEAATPAEDKPSVSVAPNAADPNAPFNFSLPLTRRGQKIEGLTNKQAQEFIQKGFDYQSLMQEVKQQQQEVQIQFQAERVAWQQQLDQEYGELKQFRDVISQHPVLAGLIENITVDYLQNPDKYQGQGQGQPQPAPTQPQAPDITQHPVIQQLLSAEEQRQAAYEQEQIQSASRELDRELEDLKKEFPDAPWHVLEPGPNPDKPGRTLEERILRYIAKHDEPDTRKAFWAVYGPKYASLKEQNAKVQQTEARMTKARNGAVMAPGATGKPAPQTQADVFGALRGLPHEQIGERLTQMLQSGELHNI